MKGLIYLAGGMLAFGAVGCGMFGDDKPEQLDPYRAVAADEINAVLYTGKSPEKILKKLGELGVQEGRLFGEFKSTTKIEDWFGEEWADGKMRYTSLTCGLSPVVDDAGRMTGFFRNKKFVEEQMYPEIALTPGLE